MQLNEKVENILVKKLKKYQEGELPIITAIIIGSILRNGIDYFKNMTDEEAEEIINKFNAPKDTETDGKKRIQLISPELNIDMLTIKRELCTNCEEYEIENFIVYCNRAQNIENSEKEQLIDTLLQMVEETNKFTDEEISERTDLDPDSFYELTGWKLDTFNENE